MPRWEIINRNASTETCWPKLSEIRCPKCTYCASEWVCPKLMVRNIALKSWLEPNYAWHQAACISSYPLLPEILARNPARNSRPKFYPKFNVVCPKSSLNSVLNSCNEWLEKNRKHCKTHIKQYVSKCFLRLKLSHFGQTLSDFGNKFGREIRAEFRVSSSTTICEALMMS